MICPCSPEPTSCTYSSRNYYVLSSPDIYQVALAERYHCYVEQPRDATPRQALPSAPLGGLTLAPAEKAQEGITNRETAFCVEDLIISVTISR
jgi:hypothetical protein